MTNQVGCAGASEKHLCILYYEQFSQEIRKQTLTKHIQQLSEYMATETEQIC